MKKRNKQPRADREQPLPEIWELRSEEVEAFLSLSPSEVAKSLRPYFEDAARGAVEQFFQRSEFTRFINIGTLETDAQALVIRAETLHSLMAAAAAGTEKAYRAAGYRAGVSFGLGIVKWLMGKSKDVKGFLGLPKSPRDLLLAATKIDEASRWGRITVGSLTKGQPPEFWFLEIDIESDFLSTYHILRGVEDAKLFARHRAFWSSYLEGTFSAALAAAYGVRATVDPTQYEQEQPVLTRVTYNSDESRDSQLRFRVSGVVPSRYPSSLENLCRELLCPYVLGDYKTVILRARSLVEEFVRELADAKPSPTEKIKDALTWLGQAGPNSGRNSASLLQEGRKILHESHHVIREVVEAEASLAVQAVTPGLLRALHEIELTDSQRVELSQVLRHGIDSL